MMVSRRFDASSSASASIEPDPDERFVAFKAATWTLRVLDRYPRLDIETLDMSCWLLGPEAIRLGELVLERAPDKEHEALRGELAECELEPCRISRLLENHVSMISRSQREELFAELLDLVEKRRAKLGSKKRSPLETSLHNFQRAFDLSDLERELLTLLHLCERWDPLEMFFDRHLSCKSSSGYKYLAAALDITRSDVNQLVRGNVARLGLLGYQFGGLSVDDELEELLLDPLGVSSRSGIYRTAPRERLGLDAHALDPGVVDQTLALLRSTSDKPVHIMLYGPAGAGKSTFARRLGQESERPVLEVPPNESDRTTTRRLGLLACLRLKNGGEGVTVLVDEADALLETVTAWSKRGDQQDKAWLNEVLETPRSRVIWITNSISGIEPSVLRRFAFSVRFQQFNREQRAQLWDRVLRRHRIKRFFATQDIRALARRYEVSAGAVDIAVATAASLDRRRRKEVQRAVERALDAHLTLTTGRVDGKRRDSVDADYSLDGLSLDGDVDALIERLEGFGRYLAAREDDRRRNHSMNILFYGPPGTGKSELARFLADRLDKELVVKLASDLLDPFVGMTEQKIAAAFAEAERNEAILVIDEIDTMLFSRAAATRSWQVSQVNELLTQMERFRGVLIATTNRLEALDEASLRRFGEKVGFDFLTSEGVEIFYDKMLTSLAAGEMSDDLRQRLCSLANLTPGDFKLLRDRWSFTTSKPTHQKFVNELDAESRLKESQRKTSRIGF